MTRDLVIPAELLPADGRFGAGPSKVPAEALAALAASGPRLLGTSHRQEPVKALVGGVQEKLAQLYALPEGYRVVLGLGGASAFWDVATFSLVRERSAHGVFGEFGGKFAAASAAAPWLAEPFVGRGEPGTVAWPDHDERYDPDLVDVFAYPHNETSTGVMVPQVLRGPEHALTVVDGTSAAGGLWVDPADVDVYYFSPQKGLASDGGLWFALMSPAALARVEEIAASGRFIPAFLDLSVAVENSAKRQTLNTPAIATLFLVDAQLDRMLAQGGLAGMVSRTNRNAAAIYDWAEEREWATPFVANPALRSAVVATVDLATEGDLAVDAGRVSAVLRANGVVDVDPYRKLGRNQLRVACFPAVETDDLRALTRSVDWVVEQLRSGA
ncbi:phosphoserine transaminase [Nocardioides zeae]|uniref:phosphoserine transaminase n=1 Tax=Nocardioides imazamoxiresistens TaxID=3231893 RepID=A0ABU3PS30_9ACTN|nr:phosphoserine transaminase [Nocardioides zeae]MDT9592004.1 phosphoserine transaminase [Nocardioides zeae]